MSQRQEFDFVIVGAGSAGCVLAEKLSACGKYTVAVVEAGARDTSLMVKIPAGAMRLGGNPDFDWCYMSQPDPSREGRSDAWPRGKVVGGSSSINGQLWVKGQDEDYDAWADAGNAGWSATDVAPYFRSIEHFAGPDADDVRGTDGPLHIEPLRKPHLLTEAFVAAAAQTGLPVTSDYNGVQQEGAGIAQVTQKRGLRTNSSTAFLKRALKRKNVQLITKALVRSIVIEGKQARGIIYSQGGNTQTLHARREVILSAGAINSPQLLMLSGIGPAQHLRDVGVEVVHDLPGVGQNMQEHPGVWVAQDVVSSVRTINQEANALGVLRNGLRFLIDGTGAAATPPAQGTAFIRSGPGAASPDVQVLFTPIGYTIEGKDVKPMATPAMMAVPCVCHPDSRGHLQLASASAEDKPLIHPNLLGDERDLARLRGACRWVRDLFNAPAMKPYAVRETLPGPDVQSNEEWDALFRAAAGPVYHISSTCAMGSGGSQNSMSVVDDRLRVHGISGLRVADNAIMPRITSGNTQAPAMMIGAKAAAMIMKDA